MTPTLPRKRNILLLFIKPLYGFSTKDDYSQSRFVPHSYPLNKNIKAPKPNALYVPKYLIYLYRFVSITEYRFIKVLYNGSLIFPRCCY